jgi:hypothetical protein
VIHYKPVINASSFFFIQSLHSLLSKFILYLEHFSFVPQKDNRESAFAEWLRVKKEQKKREEKMKQAQEEEVTEGRKVHTKRQCERAFRR